MMLPITLIVVVLDARLNIYISIVSKTAENSCYRSMIVLVAKSGFNSMTNKFYATAVYPFP